MPVVALLCALAWSGAPAAGTGARGLADRPQAGVAETVVVRSGRELTVSWSARSRAPLGRFRLYRVDVGSDLELVAEEEVVPGEHTYRVRDPEQTAGTVLYQLRFRSGTGRETTLGTLLCLEAGFENPPSSTTPAPDHWAVVPDPFGVASPRGAPLAPAPDRAARGFRPEPEKPPPRPAST